MVEFKEITSKSVSSTFEIKDINEEYKVKGTASYNKDNKVENVNGQIISNTEMYVCSFNIYKMGDSYKLNISDFEVGKGAEFNLIVETVLTQLKETYPSL